MAEPRQFSGGGAGRGAPGRGPRGPGRGGRRPPRAGEEPGANGGGPELVEKVVFINRSSKVVKGGRRFSFSALVVIGDRQGRVGVGLGKAGEVADAIRKGGDIARQAMVKVALKDTTIPHDVFFTYGGAKVLLRPASPGTGVIAGKTVRAVLESAGVKDVLSKSLGSSNPSNVVKATLSALQELRLAEDIFRSRGLERKRAPVAAGEARTEPPPEAAAAETAAEPAPAEPAGPEAVPAESAPTPGEQQQSESVSS